MTGYSIAAALQTLWRLWLLIRTAEKHCSSASAQWSQNKSRWEYVKREDGARLIWGGGCETHHVKICLQYIASFISNQHCTRQFVLKRNETNWNDTGKIGLHPYREKICLHFVPFRSISGQSELIIVPINPQSTNQSSHCCVAHVRQIAPTLCHQTEWVVYECFMVVWTWNYYASRTWDMCHDCWLQFAALN